MIGDLLIDARLTFSKLKRNYALGDLGIQIGVKGKYAIDGVRSVTTSDGVLPLGDIGTIGWICLKNLGASLISTPAAPAVANIGAAGGTTYTYKVVARQADGGYTVASATGTTATGNATLNGTNFNRITWTPVDDAIKYDVYRTVGGATQGKIGTTPEALPGDIPAATFDDTGLVGDGVTAPSTTPYDFTIIIGSDGSLYPNALKGGDEWVVRWNAAAIHHKASFNTSDMAFLIVEA